MNAFLKITNDDFSSKLREIIDEGTSFLNDFKNSKGSESTFLQIEKKFKQWDNYNQEFLTQVFDNPQSSYFFEYRDAESRQNDAIVLVSRGANPNSVNFRIKFFKTNLEAKIDSLENILNKSQLIPTQSTLMKDHVSSDEINKVFISHSSNDKAVVGELIDLLESIGMKSNQIFCSSYEGYGIELGDDFLNRIKEELNANVLVLFVLTKNFYDSPVCLCEMGATWVKTNQRIPILVPPFDFTDIKGVFPLTQGLKITDPQKLNTLKVKIEATFSITPAANFSIWERKRDKIVNNILSLI